MKLPRKVRIGYLDYRVTEMPEGSPLEGEHDPKKGTLKVKTRRRSQQYVLNTLLHEIGHGVFYSMGLQNVPGIGDAEEMLVNCFMNGLSQVLRDNPDIRKFLRMAR